MGPDWIFSDSQIETLYRKGFFFLFDIESTYTNKNNDELKIILRSKHTCSGYPPHFLLIERTHFKVNDKTDEVKLTKEEVLEGGDLTLAPTKQDRFGDFLYRVVKDDKELQEFLLRKGFLSTDQLKEFIRIQEKTGKASFGKALIEKGMFSEEEWKSIVRQYSEEKGERVEEMTHVLRK